MPIEAREGDFIETPEGLIFDVKGMVHPPDRIVAYLRYLIDPHGERWKNGRRYTKVYPLREREEVLKKRYPQYIYYDSVFGEYMQGVPRRHVLTVYKPQDKVTELLKKPKPDSIEAEAIELVQILKEHSGVKLEKMGISGSILLGLHTEKSDIDVIIYGKKNCISVHTALNSIMKRGETPIRRYSYEDLLRLYRFRSKDTWMPIEDFMRIEQRKSIQGKIRERDFFIRFIPDWNEVNEKYGDRIYIPAGYAKIKARVLDDSESIFTPCKYLICDVEFLEGTKVSPLREVASFRGRFCEQARKGEEVIAQGKVEKVIEKDGTEFFRLLLGARFTDFMISKPR